MGILIILLAIRLFSDTRSNRLEDVGMREFYLGEIISLPDKYLAKNFGSQVLTVISSGEELAVIVAGEDRNKKFSIGQQIGFYKAHIQRGQVVGIFVSVSMLKYLKKDASVSVAQ